MILASYTIRRLLAMLCLCITAVQGHQDEGTCSSTIIIASQVCLSLYAQTPRTVSSTGLSSEAACVSPRQVCLIIGPMLQKSKHHLCTIWCLAATWTIVASQNQCTASHMLSKWALGYVDQADIKSLHMHFRQRLVLMPRYTDRLHSEKGKPCSQSYPAHPPHCFHRCPSPDPLYCQWSWFGSFHAHFQQLPLLCKKKKNFTCFGQSTRLITCSKA